MPGGKAQDLTWERRGKLFIVRFAGIIRTAAGNTKRMWLARCDCGKLKEYPTERLNQTVKYVSCGCERNKKFYCISRLN